MRRRSRVLYKSQEKLLQELYLQGVKSVDDMSGQQWARLFKMRPHELLWAEANRYLDDLRLAEIIKGRGFLQL